MRKLFLFITTCFCLLGALYAADKPIMEPERMTPLVGRSCVVNQIDKSLIELFGDVSALGNIVDTNINNYTNFSSLAGIDAAYHQIISIKDAERAFKGGTEAGFVMQSTSQGTNLLTADVLEMFVVETYKDGEKQESSVNSATQSGLLDLNLITIATDGKTKVSIKTTKDFDEVRLAITGVNADAFSNLRLYYAYAGENEMQPVTKTEFYGEASVHGSSIAGIGDSWTTAIWNWPNQKEKLVGANSENTGVGFGTLSSLLTEPRVTINAGKTIPANTEIGFVIETGSVLAINVLQNTVLTTYDINNNEVESKTIVSVLGLSAIGGGRTTVSMITTQPCQQIKIKFGGLNIDVGGTKIFYAYTRDANVSVNEECNLKLSANLSVCSQSSYQLSGIDGIVWSVEEQPVGANATVSTTGLVENMTIDGEYVIKAQKGTCVDYVTINNSPSAGVSYECNRPIVGNNIAPFSPAGGGCLLCISPDLDNGALNVVDNDLTNYIEYTKGLDLLSNTSIYGVQRTDNDVYQASVADPRRVGFVMQATDQFLTADVLKFFVVKTYLGDQLQESSPVDENDAVGANLIGGKDNLMRFSFVATKPFNKVTIWTAGVLSLNLSKFRIYYAFEEPATTTCLNQFSTTACLSLLSAQQHGASIDYGHTGFGGVANVGATMRNLANVIDGDISTFAYIGKTAGVAANTTLSVKMNQVFEHGYQAGFVVKEQTWVGNVDLLRAINIKTFLNGVATGDENLVPEVLSLDLIGSAGKSLITVTPTLPFDEIQLDMGGLIDALVELNVFGAFVQADIDGDGTPDCLDKNPCGTQLKPEVFTSCGDSHVEVSIITSYDSDKTYTLWDGQNEHDFENGVASFEITPGKWNCIIRENGVDIYSNLIVEVHSTYTEWTGEISSDWNAWENWNGGVPGECTNVLIPSVDSLNTTNGIHYPILEQGQGIYICHNIYLKPGAELVNQNLLTYNKAWVAFNVLPEKNNMMTVPLEETFSGDFFVYKKSGENEALQQEYKNPLKDSVLIGSVNRSVPFASTSIWNGTQWMPIKTVLDRKFLAGEGLSVTSLANTNVATSTPLEMIFGKEDKSYNKVNVAGIILPSVVAINRDTLHIGRFSYDTDTLSVTLNGQTGQSIYVVGNPFVSHLNISMFLEHNSSILKPFVKVNNDLENNPNSNYNSTLTELVASDNAKIAPTHSFFVETLTPVSGLTIQFTKDMMVAGDYEAAQQAASQTRAANQGSDNNSNLELSSLKAYPRNGEGIIESAEKVAKLQVFTVSGKLILEKQNVVAPVHVPLSDGVNLIKVQTENETKTFKLIK